jgi:hypothetical protein
MEESHTLQMLQMSKLNMEGMSKIKIIQKLDLFCETVSQSLDVKEKFLKEIKNSIPVNKLMIAK